MGHLDRLPPPRPLEAKFDTEMGEGKVFSLLLLLLLFLLLVQLLLLLLLFALMKYGSGGGGEPK
jgi:hypothetical protein